MAAEERKKLKEQIKIIKEQIKILQQQKKIKHIQRSRMEKELRARQIVEAKRRKMEEAANARKLKAEELIKDKELRRQQAEIIKQQAKRRKMEEAANARKLKAEELIKEKQLRRQQAEIIKQQAKQRKMEEVANARKQKAEELIKEKELRRQQAEIVKQQEKQLRRQQAEIIKQQAKQRKMEEVANARKQKAEELIKDKELRRQQAEIIKQQERERRRQHVIMLLKDYQARKKAKEHKPLEQEEEVEMCLNQEPKLERRRLKLDKTRELKDEDMCLSDHKPLPEFSRIPGLVLPGRAVSDCLVVMHFLQGFGKVLGLEPSADVPTLGMLQEDLLNMGDSRGQVQDLLVKLVSLAVYDPGLPPGQKTETLLGDQLTDVGIDRDNVSEVLRLYMDVHCAHSELAPLAFSLKTKAFQALTPAQKISILCFLTNELACSTAVTSEMDKRMNQMETMKKDKIIMEGELKKLRTIHAKRTGKMKSSEEVEEKQSVRSPSSAVKRKRKLEGDSDDSDGDGEDDSGDDSDVGDDSDDDSNVSYDVSDDDSDDDSDDQVEDDEDEEEEEIRVEKEETCDKDEVEHVSSLEELEEQIEKLSKQHHQTRRKLFEISHSLQPQTYGQDRYHRRYWGLPHCGGVFIEAMESGAAPEELEEERQRQRRATEEDKQNILSLGLEEETQYNGKPGVNPATVSPKSLARPSPRPIPEEMLSGWWRVSNIEELRSLDDALHCRGIREKFLQKEIHKYMEILPEVCTKHRDVAAIERREPEESRLGVASAEGWCVEEHAVDMAVLQQVEELERKVAAARLQVKRWRCPDPQSQREDLVHYEHKPPTKPTPACGKASHKDSKDSGEHPEDREEERGVVRHLDNPLDIAVTRLAKLERNVERRYLSSPLGSSVQIQLGNVGTVAVPAPPSRSADRKGVQEEVSHGMEVWRGALKEVRSAAQLTMCIQQLQKSISWEKSIMKVYCQVCKKGNKEDLLMLCDGCEKGCHTFCHKPKISRIPKEDWFCPACISTASCSPSKSKKPPNKPVASRAGNAKKGGEAKKETGKKRKAGERSANQERPAKRAKTCRDNNRDSGGK